MNINKAIKIIILAIIFIIIGIVIHIYINKNFIPTTNIPLQDTSYNRIELDSIKYDIKIKDTIIYKIKQKIKIDEQQIMALDDSSTIKLFYQLVTTENKSN